MHKLTRRAAIAAATIAALAMPTTAALAAGSDAPTPYTVTVEGLQLPAGETFPAHGHVNWRTTWASHGIHFDPNNNQPGGAYIGENFLAWPHPLEPGECITWVQVSTYNEHFGEGGQQPVCAPSVPVTPPQEPQPEPEPPVVVPEPETPAEPETPVHPQPEPEPTVDLPTPPAIDDPSPVDAEPVAQDLDDPLVSVTDPATGERVHVRATDELAQTGPADFLMGAAGASLLILGGTLFVLLERRRRDRRATAAAGPRRLGRL